MDSNIYQLVLKRFIELISSIIVGFLITGVCEISVVGFEQNRLRTRSSMLFVTFVFSEDDVFLNSLLFFILLVLREELHRVKELFRALPRLSFVGRGSGIYRSCLINMLLLLLLLFMESDTDRFN